MVSIPAGIAIVGTETDEPGHVHDEGPVKEVQIDAFEVSRFEITRGEFAAFVQATGYADEVICLTIGENGQWQGVVGSSWEDPGFEQTDNHPAACISWDGAKAYADWLNIQEGSAGGYRLLSESEWDYAARAGTRTPYWWGETEDDFCTVTNGADVSAKEAFPVWPRTGSCNDGFVFTAPVGHFEAPNAFGLEDMVGNVWEWVEDCYVDNYETLPPDGAPQRLDPCEKRVFRGGAWGDYGSFYLRSGYRGTWTPEQTFSNIGFRVARSVTP